jgi:hypothetical protein
MPPADSTAIQRHKDQQSFASLWDLKSSIILDRDGAAQQT